MFDIKLIINKKLLHIALIPEIIYLKDKRNNKKNVR